MAYYGFNFQWMYSTRSGQKPLVADEKALDFLAATGFNFVRIPTDYRFWIKDFEYLKPDERLFVFFDGYLEACRSRGLHMSLNIHRGPGYCINANNIERDNLWLDKVAQDGFVFQWETFARRYLGVHSSDLSFDLLNEPPNIGQYGMTRQNHEALIRRTVHAIRAIDPKREIVIDGLGGGHIAMPELADLGVVHSGRGYQPMPVSHFKAGWWDGHLAAPAPEYPGQVWEDVVWNKQTLREFYQPWRDIEAAGARIHIGEMGCYNKTPNDIALRWLIDLFAVYKDFGWGYSLWNFTGDFGIIEHGRPGARYEQVHGYNVDKDLLDLMIRSRIT
jgi:endoglucanase